MQRKIGLFLCSMLLLGGLVTACGSTTVVVAPTAGTPTSSETPTASGVASTPGTNPVPGSTPPSGSNPSSGATPPPASAKPTPAPAVYGDLTGVWKGDDNAYYYVRQVGDSVTWAGFSNNDGVNFTNVLCATRNGNSVSGNWADVPRGNSLQSGSLSFQIDASNPNDIQLHRTATNVFGAANWHKVASWPGRYPTLPTRHPSAANLTDLTGTWFSAIPADASQYYVRQVGDSVWWLGVSPNNGLSFTNVFCGQRSGNAFSGTWADVLYGGTSSSGTILLNYYRDGIHDRFKALSATGGFASSGWTRYTP